MNDDGLYRHNISPLLKENCFVDMKKWFDMQYKNEYEGVLTVEGDQTSPQGILPLREQ